jgi:copper chaperone
MTKSRKTVKVDGMSCKNCVKTIENGVGTLDGVKKVKVDLAEDTVNVSFNPDKINIKEIKSELVALGYGVDGGNAVSKGLLYGLLPHTGCIAFLLGSILGVTALMQFFKPLMMNRNFFYILIGISLGFAIISSLLYLRQQGLLSWKGIKKRWKYLTTMLGSTLAINLVLFMVIFPMLANVSAAPIEGGDATKFASISLSVDIPCPGHAPLISEELKTLEGVVGIEFNYPNNFDVVYDAEKTLKTDILGLEVFRTYGATVLDESGLQDAAPVVQSAPSLSGVPVSCGGGTGACGSYQTGVCGCGS